MDKLLELPKKDIIAIFNDELTTFLSELIKIFSALNKKDNIAALVTYKTMIENGISINNEIAIEMFSSYIFGTGNEEFCSKISARDYSFFFNTSFVTDETNKLAEIITIIKSLFIELSEGNKENIFGYLENLSTLANIYTMKNLSK